MTRRTAVHYGDPHSSAMTWCNAPGGTKTLKPPQVTCKKCLAKLKKEWGYVPEVAE